jgi:L-ribulose-5-phosphate 3-epimerase
VLAGTLQLAKALGFDFVEMSVDETDAAWRARLEPRAALRAGQRDCGNRGARAVHVPERPSSFPLGSEDDAVRAQGLEIMRKAIRWRRMWGSA